MNFNHSSKILAIITIAGGACFASFMNGPKDDRRIFVAGQPTPDMNGRREELIPQKLPGRVRYMFAANEVVNGAADILIRGLQNGDPGLYDETIMLQPGGWKALKDRCNIGRNQKGHVSVLGIGDIKKGKFDGGLEMKFIRDKDEIAVAAAEIAKMLKEDGGFVVRALRTDEMAKWWIFIGFDIEEPVFVAASKGGKYRFVFALNSKNKASIVDELMVLPAKA